MWSPAALRVLTFRQPKQPQCPKTKGCRGQSDEKEKRIFGKMRPFHDDPQDMRQGQQGKDGTGSYDICFHIILLPEDALVNLCHAHLARLHELDARATV